MIYKILFERIIMKHGFFKVATACPNVTVADCNANVQEMIKVAESAHKDGVRMLVFPELCITGYTCADLFYSDVLVKSAEDALSDYLEKSRIWDMISIIGLPLFVNDKIYNCATFCQNKQILGIVPKTCIPNYGEYYEGRYFAQFTGDAIMVDVCGDTVPFGNGIIFSCSNVPTLKIGIEICEDLFSSIPPSSQLSAAGATVIANPAASSELVGKADERRLMVTSQSSRALCGYVFANAYDGESTTDSVFPHIQPQHYRHNKPLLFRIISDIYQQNTFL